MKRALCIFCAVLMFSGCASIDAPMPVQDPLSWSNPSLLRCPGRQSPVCNVSGGRLTKRYSNCRCGTV